MYSNENINLSIHEYINERKDWIKSNEEESRGILLGLKFTYEKKCALKVQIKKKVET